MVLGLYRRARLKTLGALTLALLLFLSIVSGSRAEQTDYHWLDTFGDYFDSVGGTVTAFDFSPSGKLYVGGDFISAGSDANGDPQIVNGTAMWDGTEWHPLGGGFGLQFGGLLPSVSKIIAVSDTEVYFSGFFAYIMQSPDGVCPQDCLAVRGVAKWDGQSWSGLGPDSDHLGVSGPAYADVGDMEFYNGSLWITGLFSHAGDTEAHGIARWDGVDWHAAGGEPNYGMHGNGYGTALATDGTALYIGGNFQSVEGVSSPNIIKYTEGGFTSLGGLEGVNISSIVVDATNIYAGGAANDVNDYSLWKFNGTSWSVLGGGVYANFYNSTPGYVNELFLDGNRLYVGGQFGRVGANTLVANLAIWDFQTETWSQFGNPIGYPGGSVSSVARNGDRIFVGGQFSQIGGLYLQNGEDFTFTPGKSSLSLAIYDPNALPPPLQADQTVYLNVSNSTVDVGDTIDVCISVQNLGPDSADSTTLTTSVPDGTVLDSPITDYCGGGGGETRRTRVQGLAFPFTAPDCTTPNPGESGPITCTYDNLAQYDSFIVAFSVVVTGAPGSQISFTASVSGTPGDSNTANDIAAETVSIRPNIAYVSANSDCGLNTPCYSSINDAFSNVSQNGTVNVGAGEYHESLYLYNWTVNLGGDVSLSGGLYLYGGVLNSTNGTLSVSGSIENSGGEFHHNNGTLRFNGTDPQYVYGTFDFYNVTIETGAVVEVGSVVLHIEGVLVNNGLLRSSSPPQYISTGGTASFTDGTNTTAIELVSTGQSDLGDTYVTVTMNETAPFCGNDPLPVPSVLRHFDISPSYSEGIEATIRLYYRADELNGIPASAVRMYHCGYDDETSEYKWELLPGQSGPNGAFYVETQGVTTFSPFALGGAVPTNVELIALRASPHKKGGIAVKWQTGSEIDIVGFNVWRSKKEDGNYKQVNKETKSAKSPGQTVSNKYTWRDKNAAPEHKYYYKLEILKSDGSSSWSDPVKSKSSNK